MSLATKYAEEFKWIVFRLLMDKNLNLNKQSQEFVTALLWLSKLQGKDAAEMEANFDALHASDLKKSIQDYVGVIPSLHELARTQERELVALRQKLENMQFELDMKGKSLHELRQQIKDMQFKLDAKDKILRECNIRIGEQGGIIARLEATIRGMSPRRAEEQQKMRDWREAQKERQRQLEEQPKQNTNIDVYWSMPDRFGNLSKVAPKRLEEFAEAAGASPAAQDTINKALQPEPSANELVALGEKCGYDVEIHFVPKE